MKNDHKYYALFSDEKSVRRLVQIHQTEFGGFSPMGITCYSTFGSDGEMINNGTYPIIKAEDFRRLEGRLLTMCDATFSDPKQREAFKDLLKTQTREWYDRFVEGTAIYSNQLFDLENKK